VMERVVRCLGREGDVGACVGGVEEGLWTPAPGPATALVGSLVTRGGMDVEVDILGGSSCQACFTDERYRGRLKRSGAKSRHGVR
jgi:hypothetical protein